MYEKFAQTLAALPGWQVHVAGRSQAPTTQPADTTGIRPHGVLAGSRLSWARLGAQGRFWQLLKTLRPRLVFVHAPELLPLTLLWQALGPNRQFVYDIQENYALNIRTQGVYPPWLRVFLAAGVRALETLAARRAARLTLAETSYADELPFVTAANALILENKYQSPFPEQPRRWPVQLHPNQPLRLLYSGTISRLNGVFEAIGLVQALRPLCPGAHLTIIGYCQQPALLAELQALVAAANGAITLVGGAQPVPHRAIVEAIQDSHLGLLPYQPHASTWRCIPTKLYEYLAQGLPVVIPPNPLWQHMVQYHQAGLALDFATVGPAAAAALLAALGQPAFYPAGPVAAARWDSEGQKLIQLVDSIR